MGYSCTTAALRTLQAIKETCGADLDASNEIRLANGRHAFFERGDEQLDGAIVGLVMSVNGALRPRSFRINADGTIAKFPGLRQFHRNKVAAIVRDPGYRPTVAVI